MPEVLIIVPISNNVISRTDIHTPFVTILP